MAGRQKTVIGDATLTASGIARLAGVGRAAVSNWRRRYSDFPAPVGGTPTSPYFSAREIDDWLRRQGKLTQASTAQWAWRHIETYQPAAQIGDALSIAGAYLLARSEQPARNSTVLNPKQLATRLRSIDHGLAEMVGTLLPAEWGPQLSTVLHAVDQLARENEPEAAFEYLHNQYLTSAQSMSGLAGTPDTVAEIMVTLAGTGHRTFDFTCGTGSILRMAAQRALDSGTPTQCYAQEIRKQYALIALIRLWFVHRRTQRAGQLHDAAPLLHIGDSLLADAFPDLRADVVVSNFPFGIHDWGHDQLVYDARWSYGLPPRTEPELAWVQHALAHLAPHGTAVVLMPPAASTRPAGRRIRAELVRRGALRAVIALPAGLMPPTGVGLQIWVLTQPEPDQVPDTRLLFVDATNSRHLAETISQAWRSFQAGEHADAPGIHRAVPAIELLDERVDLTPRRHLTHVREHTANVGHTLARIDKLNRLLTELRDAIPNLRENEPPSNHTTHHVSLADLVRAGSMSVRRAQPDRSPGASSSGRNTRGAAQLSSGSQSGLQTAITDAEPLRMRTNDIIVSSSGSEIAAWVVTDNEDGSDVATGLHLIQLQPGLLDPWFIAGMLSYGDHPNTERTTSETRSGSRLDLRKLTIPVLAQPEQERYGRAFRTLWEFLQSLDTATSLGTAIVHEVGADLVMGRLSPTD
jgi:hypothetical protein